MGCDYFNKENGKTICKAYGNLNGCSPEKILECESNFTSCLERTIEFLKRKDCEEKGIWNYLFSRI